MKISVVIITKNEEENLPRTLKSVVSWCDEILIIDSGSTDNTVAIANSFGATVIYNKFESFGKQKIFGVNAAKYNWILSIDADEVISDKLKTEILALKNNSNLYQSYFIPSTNVFLGSQPSFGKESRVMKIKFFNRETCNFNENEVHEKVVTNSKSGYLKNVIIHYSYKSLHDYFSKFNLYTENAANQMFAQNKRRPFLLNFLMIPFYFINIYILKKNFLNGVEGLIWSTLSTVYTFVKYCKLEEMHIKKKTNNYNY
jgi:glycosyltransferase involved in cell wall biosynthesis